MTDPEPTSEEQHLRAELDLVLERLRDKPPMGGFGFELLLCGFERDRRANEEILDQMMQERVRVRARFKEQLDANHTDTPIPPPEGSDPPGEPAPDPQPA